jgi:nitrogen-specific signal transduction histidine kinase
MTNPVLQAFRARALPSLSAPMRYAIALLGSLLPAIVQDVLLPEPAISTGGLGLGMAVAKGLVEMHAGTVSASSQGLGKGAEFIVRVPLEASAPSTVPEARSAPRLTPSRRVG